MLKAGFGGIVGTGADLVSLTFLVEVVGIAIPLAAFCAALVGAALCFVMNKYVAFRDPRPVSVQQVGRFGFVALAAAGLMAVAMKLVAVELHVPYLIAKLGCAAIIFAIWTYPAQRWLVFESRRAVTA
jgi:putative flippase GtrA